MTCFLELYRQRIGEFDFSSAYGQFCRKFSKSGTKSVKVRTAGLSVLIMVIVFMMVGLLFIILRQGLSGYSTQSCIYSLCYLRMAPFLSVVANNEIKFSYSDVTARSEKYIERFLTGASPFWWITKQGLNKLAHVINGNRGQRGRGITCIYWNKGSSLLKNKMHNIKSLVQDHSPHIFGLGEANLKLGHDLEDVNIPGYNLHADNVINCSQLANTARVVVYTHNLLKVKRRFDLEVENVSAVWLECGLPNQKKSLICMAYRQWRLPGQADDRSASVNQQLVRWSSFLTKWESALAEGKEVLVMMDANLDHLTWGRTDNLPSFHSSCRLKDLIDLLFAKIIPLGVSQLVTVATRFERGHPISGLDHIYSNKPDKLSTIKTYYTGCSDHKMLKVTRFSKSFKQLPRYVKKRVFKDFCPKVFIKKLSEANIEEVLLCNDVNKATNCLQDKICTILDSIAPVRTIQMRTNYVHGLSKETKELQRERNLAQEKAASTNDPEDWKIFRSLRNQSTSSVRKDKRKWEAQKFSQNENNTSSDIWKSVKGFLGWNTGGPPSQLLYGGRIVTRPAGLASCMNEYFVNKVVDLRQRIPLVDSDPLKYMKQAMSSRSCSFQLKPVQLCDIEKQITSLKNSSATGIDFIDTRSLKLGMNYLAPAIQHIVNLSMTTSTFPDIWKLHKVTPLLKGTDHDKMLPKSYRPVALLPVISKVLEKVVFGQLVDYLEKNKLIHPNLHGSRAGHSTSTALNQLYDYCIEEVEKGSMVGVLLCDQSAAFDLCDHSLLLEKLRLMGIEESFAAWISSYLSERKQSCIIDGHISSPVALPQCGVPQGSIGGPILWLIFTCDQPDATHEHAINIEEVDRGCSLNEDGGSQCGILVGYVDDGGYCYSNPDPVVLSNVLTDKFIRLAEWMNSNKLVLNPDKTHLMVMGNRRHAELRSQVRVMAGESSISPSKSEKLLGGHLDQNLGWALHLRDHKSSLLRQLISRINGLKRVCVNATFETKLMVANGIVMSKLTYLITLWGGACQYLLNGLQVQQLTAARLVCGIQSWRWSKRQLLGKVRWLSVRQLIVYHSVLQIHKTKVTGVPQPFFKKLCTEYPRMTRNATAGAIRQTAGASTLTFRYRAINYYNLVPVEVRTGSITTVKKNLRKWIKYNVPID